MGEDRYGYRVVWMCMKKMSVVNETLLIFFFFFQAEDGIRDDLVTGVQTCALPILRSLTSDRYDSDTTNGMVMNFQ